MCNQMLRFIGGLGRLNYVLTIKSFRFLNERVKWAEIKNFCSITRF